MTRIELENAVFEKSMSDMQIVFEYSKEEIQAAIKAAEDEDLIQYLDN